MRLGEALVQEGVINEEQLEKALQAHRQFGGRLGTSLIELGYVHPDVVARALSRKHSVPPALRKHFAAIDPRVVPLVPASAAQKYGAIPLGFTSTTPSRLVVAFIDPNPEAVDAIAFVVGKRVEPGVAPELQIYFCLEKLYGVKREQKYVQMAVDFDTQPEARTPTSRERAAPKVILTPPPPPIAPRAGAAGPSTQRSNGPVSYGTQRGFPSPDPKLQSVPPGARIEPPKVPRVDGAQRVAHAKLVLEGPPLPTLATDSEPPPSDPAPPITIDPASTGAVSTARIATPPSSDAVTARSVSETNLAATMMSQESPSVTQAVRPPQASAPWFEPAPPGATVPEPEERPALSLSGFLEAIEAATSKEEIGDAIVDYLKSSYGAGLVLIHRDDMALGWRGFADDVERTSLEAIALPLSTPSVFKAALDSKTTFRGAPPADGAVVQSRLFKLLKCASPKEPKEVVVAPIVLGKRIVNFVYAHGFGGGALPETVGTDIADVANAAAEAYMRLIRAK